jgi:SAM-dependent methyltransferase
MLAQHHYPAELYELVHRGTPGDLAFYRRVCTGVGNVLELGCGYGRVLSTLSELGVPITGLDRDPELLALAEQRAAGASVGGSGQIDFVLGDMTDFDLISNARGTEGGVFDRILIPYSGLYCLLSDEACEACFRRVAQHLRPGGFLVLDAYVADLFHGQTSPFDHDDTRLDPIVSVEYRGHVYDVFERSRWERSAQRLDVTYEYIPRHGGEALQGSIGHRYLLRGQLEILLQRAGLQLVSLAGDWEGGVLRDDSDVFVAVATHHAGPR